MKQNETGNWWALLSAASLVARRRLRADWRLQGAVAFGMVLAAALMASGVIYSAVLRQAALRHTLVTSPQTAVNLRVEAFSPVDPAIFASHDRLVQREAFQPLQPYLKDQALFVQTPTFFFKGRADLETPETSRPRGPLQSFTRLAEHVQVAQGRLPAPNAPSLEVVLEPDAAASLGVKPGDSLDMYMAVIADRARSLKATVVGIVQATDPEDEYWFGSRQKLTNTASGWLWAPMFTTQDAIFKEIKATYGETNVNFSWYFYLDKQGVRATEADRLALVTESVLGRLRTGIEGSAASTDLPAVLSKYEERLVLGRLPLFLVIFLVVGTLMYYLFLVAGLLARERESETALLKGRGATSGQVAFLALVEGLFMAAPAIAVGPVLALLMVFLTDRVAPAQVGTSGLLDATFSWQAYLLGAGGALMAVAVLTLASLLAARRTIVEVRQSQARPATTLFFQRRYLDVFVLVLVVLLWWQTRQGGTFLVQRLGSEGFQIDFSLLLGPVLGLVAAGLIVLRLFPLAVSLLSRLMEPVAPVWLLQAVRRLERNPTPAGLLVLLLLLATGLGVVGAAFSASLEQSQRDQVLYQAGADVRVQHTGGAWAMSGQGPAQALTQQQGVARATDVLRGSGWATTTGFGNDVTIMAVDPREFASVAWFRPDFSRVPLAAALGQPGDAPRSQGLALPQNAEKLTVWVTQRRADPRYELMARLHDANGHIFDVSFGTIPGRGWQQLTAPIKTPEAGSPRSGLPAISFARPYSLLAIVVASRRGGWLPDALFLDDLQADLTGGSTAPLADFQSMGEWRVLQDYGSTNPVALEPNETIARSGRQALSLSWGAGGSGIRGLQYGPGLEPVLALASPALMQRNKVAVGDTLNLWAFGAYMPVQVVGIADYFPTVYPDKDAFVIVDIRRAGAFTGLHAATARQPNGETWVRGVFPGSADSTALRDAVRNMGFWVYSVEDANRSLGTRVADPLVTAGWSGLLALAFLTVVLASVSGLLLYSYIDAREHQTEFALMRTLGFSRNELGGVVWFNLVIVAGLGIGLGSVLGFQLGRWLLPLLEVAEGGRRITPPMVLETNWAILGVTYAVLAVAAAVTVAVLTWLLGRLELQRVLRMGEA